MAASKWMPVMNVRGRTMVWYVRHRPFAFNPTIAYAATIETSALRAGLYNGNGTPGGGPWKNGNRVQTAARPALVAAFNGGFLFHDILGGYRTEGRTMKAMRKGDATLVITNAGVLQLGLYGLDLTDYANYRSVRQDMPPIVRGGRVSLSNYPGTYWGANVGNVKVTNRSGICKRNDNRLMYVFMPNVTVEVLAAAMAQMRCVLAMQLDANGPLPLFMVYAGFGSTNRSGIRLNDLMGSVTRFTTFPSEKDFFALFDPATLPAGVVA
jgi:hypothetical protein